MSSVVLESVLRTVRYEGYDNIGITIPYVQYEVVDILEKLSKWYFCDDIFVEWTDISFNNTMGMKKCHLNHDLDSVSAGFLESVIIKWLRSKPYYVLEEANELKTNAFHSILSWYVLRGYNFCT